MIILGTISIDMTLLALLPERQQVVQGLAVIIGQFRLGAVDITVFWKQRSA